MKHDADDRCDLQAVEGGPAFPVVTFLRSPSIESDSPFLTFHVVRFEECGRKLRGILAIGRICSEGGSSDKHGTSDSAG